MPGSCGRSPRGWTPLRGFHDRGCASMRLARRRHLSGPRRGTGARIVLDTGPCVVVVAARPAQRTAAALAARARDGAVGRVGVERAPERNHRVPGGFFGTPGPRRRSPCRCRRRRETASTSTICAREFEIHWTCSGSILASAGPRWRPRCARPSSRTSSPRTTLDLRDRHRPLPSAGPHARDRIVHRGMVASRLNGRSRRERGVPRLRGRVRERCQGGEPRRAA